MRVQPAVRRRVGRIRFFTHCTKASLSDDAGLIEMLSNNIDYFTDLFIYLFIYLVEKIYPEISFLISL